MKCNRCGFWVEDKSVPESQRLEVDWDCGVCQRVLREESRILLWVHNYSEHKPNENLRRLWEYRLKVFRQLNPVGSRVYHSYWQDPLTHNQEWSIQEQALAYDEEDERLFGR